MLAAYADLPRASQVQCLTWRLRIKQSGTGLFNTFNRAPTGCRCTCTCEQASRPVKALFLNLSAHVLQELCGCFIAQRNTPKAKVDTHFK